MSSEQSSDETTLHLKLITLLSVVGIAPLVLLVVGITVGEYQPILMLAAVFCQLIGLGMGWIYGAGLVDQAKEIRQALLKISQGDFEARSKITTKDELGASARELNAICDNTLNLIQSSEEREQIQSSIEHLISEMQEIAAGNLEIRADIKDDMTGTIAESVNDMTEQLRSIVRQVKTAADQVNQYSARMREISESKSQESDSHAERIHHASQQILEMTNSFQQVASMTRESAQVAVETKQSATKGQRAVSATVDGMNRIRNQVQSTSKRIKRLGESSQEIGEIVQLISEISDRTSVLALNASIQASMAGDAGHGFAVIAQEIERLAERSSDATLQISKLIRAVQNETGEVIADMEESTREVVAGSQLATEAGETLFEIDSVSSQLVELIQTSSNYALQQAELASNFASSMSEISQSTKRSAQHSREATRAIGLLDDMVGKLGNSVRQFKIASTQEAVGLAEANQLLPQVPPVVQAKPIVQAPPAHVEPRSDLSALKNKLSASAVQQPSQPVANKLKSPSRTISKHSTVRPQKSPQKTVGAARVQQPAQAGQRARTMSYDQVMSEIRTAKEKIAQASESASTKNENQSAAPMPTSQTVARNSIPENPQTIDEQLLKQAQELLKEVKQNRANQGVATATQKSDQSQTSRTLNIGDA